MFFQIWSISSRFVPFLHKIRKQTRLLNTFGQRYGKIKSIVMTGIGFSFVSKVLKFKTGRFWKRQPFGGFTDRGCLNFLSFFAHVGSFVCVWGRWTTSCGWLGVSERIHTRVRIWSWKSSVKWSVEVGTKLAEVLTFETLKNVFESGKMNLIRPKIDSF